MRVLIVDDSAFIRMSLRSILQKNGYEIVGEAENGEKAVSQYKRLLPDVVTMDITMPVMDGISALKEIKAYDQRAKVIMISAMGQESLVKESVMYGAQTFIVKPFNEKYVVETLAKIIKK